jgi:hypothetical protein
MNLLRILVPLLALSGIFAAQPSPVTITLVRWPFT